MANYIKLSMWDNRELWWLKLLVDSQQTQTSVHNGLKNIVDIYQSLKWNYMAVLINIWHVLLKQCLLIIDIICSDHCQNIYIVKPHITITQKELYKLPVLLEDK